MRSLGAACTGIEEWDEGAELEERNAIAKLLWIHSSFGSKLKLAPLKSGAIATDSGAGARVCQRLNSGLGPTSLGPALLFMIQRQQPLPRYFYMSSLLQLVSCTVLGFWISRIGIFGVRHYSTFRAELHTILNNEKGKGQRDNNACAKSSEAGDMSMLEQVFYQLDLQSTMFDDMRIPLLEARPPDMHPGAGSSICSNRNYDCSSYRSNECLQGGLLQRMCPMP